MTDLERFDPVAVIGAGVIGASWTGLFLAHGLTVTVHDVPDDFEQKVRDSLERLSPSLAALGLSTDDLGGRLRFDHDLESAVSDAKVVQENGPENLELKQDLFGRIESATPDDVLLATSSSAINATLIASALDDGSRVIVGHPFNPPHLVPLVEVVPGEKTDPDAIEDAVAFYRGVGKRPQVLRREIPGFVANRLQAALFREAVHLVLDGPRQSCPLPLDANRGRISRRSLVGRAESAREPPHSLSTT